LQIVQKLKELLAAGRKLSESEELAEYKKIVGEISPLVGDCGVSIEVFSDRNSKAQEMHAQGEEMFTWIPNAYIKYPEPLWRRLSHPRPLT
jgi:hypothetical protein